MKDKPKQENLASYPATFEKPHAPLLDWSRFGEIV